MWIDTITQTELYHIGDYYDLCPFLFILFSGFQINLQYRGILATLDGYMNLVLGKAQHSARELIICIVKQMPLCAYQLFNFFFSFFHFLIYFCVFFSEQCEEYAQQELKAKYAEVFLRGNNVL